MDRSASDLGEERSLPRHVAIIMDGNGRWAQKRGRPRIVGHIMGCRRVREIIRESSKMGIQALTLFAFSTENWQRPQEEVSLLMRLLKKWLLREARQLMALGVRVHAAGAIEKLPKDVLQVLQETLTASKSNSGLDVTLCLSYGGRQEIVNAVKRLTVHACDGLISPEEISEDMISKFLPSTALVGDPDFVIRTSGERRISNFLLWQMAYSEILFVDTMWPDFTVKHFHDCLKDFAFRNRRFGKITEQILDESKKNMRVPFEGTMSQ